MTDTSALTIRTVADKGRGVFTARDWNTADTVVSARIVGICPARTIHSFQTGPETHCEFDEPARLLNHSCHPNLGIRDNIYGAFDFVALRSITAGDELTWDYSTSEYESIAVPQCQCGTDNCRGAIRGYRHLTPHERAEMRYSARYLRDHIEEIEDRTTLGH